MSRVLRSAVRAEVIGAGKRLAIERGVSYLDLFDDSLEADLARLQVARRVRRDRRSTPPSLVLEVVDEVLW